LGLIGGFGGVLPTFGEVPLDLIAHVILKVFIPKLNPKFHELPDVIKSNFCIHVDLRDPSIIVERMLHLPILPKRNLEYKRCYVKWS
jgi:hypothetical protein